MKLNYYHKALVVAAIGIFYTNVPLYLYDIQGFHTLEAPKHWVMILCLLAFPVLVLETKAWSALTSPIAVWCLGYASLSIIWFFQSSQSDMAWQEVRNRLFAVIEIFVFLLIFWGPDAARLARKALIGGVLMGVALCVYEFFDPTYFIPRVFGRSAGFYLNANMAAEALVLGMIFSVTAMKPVYQGPFVLFTGLGVFLTLSRGGILAWTIAVVGLMFVRRMSLKYLVVPGLICAALGVLVLFPLWNQFLTAGESSGAVGQNVQERLAWFTDPSGVSDYSSWERKYLAKRAWDKIADHPMLGSGTGSSYEAYIAPHNQYLSFMLDHGLIGAIVLPAFLLAATWGVRGESKGVAIVFGCVVLELSLFTHMILNAGYSLILFSLMAAMAGSNSNYESRRSAVMDASEAQASHAFARS